MAMENSTILFFSNLKLLYKGCLRIIAFAILLISVNSEMDAQNSPSLFKLSIHVNDSDPAWVKLMYSENPNVWGVERAYSRYYMSHPFEKSIHTQNYKYWKKNLYRNDYVSDDGFIVVPSFEAQKSKRKSQIKEWNSKKDNRKMMSNWTPLGPFETYWENDGTVKMSSQVNIYAMDQSLSDPNIMYCGTETSSVFKSIDKAQNWVSVTDGLVFGGGVHAVKVHPTNPNIVFFGTQSEIYKSVNGGTNWELVYTEGNMNVNTILIIPGATAVDYVVMATGGSVGAGGGGVYRSITQGNNGAWTKDSNEAGWDLKLKPGSSDIVYLLRSKAADQMVRFFRSTNKGAAFIEQNAGWFAGSQNNIDNTNAGARMAVTAANPEYVYVALLGDDVSRLQDVFWIGVYKSTDGGTNWTLPAGDPGGPYSLTHYNLTHFDPHFVDQSNPYQQEYYNLGIAASPTDAEKIMVGCLNLFQSTDGAATYQGIGGYRDDVGYAGYRHPDVQEIEINGNDVWVANDGGIDKYSVDWLTHEARNKGINGSEYWGFDTGWNEDILVGGRYHNGNSVLYHSYPAGQARDMGGAESGTGYINKGENRRVHTSDSQDRLMPTSISGPLATIANLGIYPNESNGDPTNAGEVKPDPRCYNHMYLTKDNNIHKSIDGGLTFTLLRAFGNDAMQKVTRIEVSRSNPQVIYVAQRLIASSTIWRTTDGGTNWAQIGLPPDISSASGFLLSLSATDQNELYIGVANGGNSNEKVYKTINGGTSWTNLSSAMLHGQRPEQIMCQQGTNGGVYIATNASVFYRNNSHADWQVFNSGAPADFKAGIIRPFYKESKIRIATENRGIWSSPLFEPSTPLAQPMASNIMVSCFDEMVQFEDFSILDHTNATWNWTFSPTPAFVDNVNIRNPKVRFGTQGTYRVTLTVTNGAGQMSTKSIPNMITVGNTCFCSPCQGCSTQYTKVGAAAEDAASCCVNLTPNTNWTKGGVWHSEKINLGNDVEFKFDLDLGNIDGNDADGAAFVLQKADNTALGQGLGNAGITPSLSVVF
ncbi:MAG: photosystem II stability/assembly factor-like uncharacterized protein, partial [Saprospiraceae bacterium]